MSETHEISCAENFLNEPCNCNVVKSEPKEVITDETVIGEVCSNDCMPERGYHLNCIGVPLKALDEPFVSMIRQYAPGIGTIVNLVDERNDYRKEAKQALLEAEANAKKAKAYDATIEFLKSEHDLPPDERLIDSPLAMIDKMHELMKEKL